MRPKPSPSHDARPPMHYSHRQLQLHATAATMSQFYGKASYWDSRYTRDPEPFDWYQNYSTLKNLLGQYVRKSDAILVSGCGNSTLSEDMYEDGFPCITNVDISSVVVDQMKERHRGKTGILWQQMNVCALAFGDASFNVVLDKGTLDSILCGKGSISNVATMCSEISRVLKPDGVFIVVSYGIPDNRLQYLQEEAYNWRVSVHTATKPSASSLGTFNSSSSTSTSSSSCSPSSSPSSSSSPAAPADADSTDASGVHYVYICQKKTTTPMPTPTPGLAAGRDAETGAGQETRGSETAMPAVKEEEEREQL